MSKSATRKQQLTVMREMSTKEYNRKSERIIERLLQSDDYQEANVIGVTISRYPEVASRDLIERAWKDGKRIVVPKCIRSDRSMIFREIHSFDQLETVYMDLLEPIENDTDPVGKEEIDLMVVPGVVFSDDGYRIGFGGGYYDRYLADFHNHTVSVCFASQTGHDIRPEPHDIPVGKIFTEDKVIVCRTESKD